MTIKFIKSIDGAGYPYKAGDTVPDAETIFGTAQTAYFLETGHAEPVKDKTEKATTADAK